MISFSDMCKQIYHNSIHCIRNRSIYVFVLRLIFRQRRLTCSLVKVFKQFTSVRLKSVKNSPSPKPTTSSTTLHKSSHFSCICDINMDNLSRKNSRIGRFVQFCILYLPKGIKNSPSSEELSEDHRISKLDYFPTSTPVTL